MTREGGSIPVTLTFAEALGVNVLLLPMGRGDDGAQYVLFRSHFLTVNAEYLRVAARRTRNSIGRITFKGYVHSLFSSCRIERSFYVFCVGCRRSCLERICTRLALPRRERDVAMKKLYLDCMPATFR